MIHFGIKQIESKFSIVETPYHHFAVFLAIGNNFGTGECLLTDERKNRFLGLESFLTLQFSKYVYNGPERFWHFLHHLLPEDSDIIRAIDMASWDLWSKLNGKSVFQSINPNHTDTKNFKTHFIPNHSIRVFHAIDSNELNAVESDVEHVLILDSQTNEESLKSLISQNSKTHFVLSNQNLLSHYSNTKQLIYFEKTQGITDIKIHLQESSSPDVFYYTSNGALITLSMLQSLVQDGNSIIAQECFMKIETGYKNVFLDEKNVIHNKKSPVYGHGIIL